tara:strand:- start:113 stop:709 length:597 start_codon:yes stop_codon:yes gene_type:complete
MDISKLKYNKLPGLTSAFEPMIYDCPFSEQLRDPLIKWICDKADARVRDGALKTKFYTGSERELPEHHILFDWIESILVEAVEDLSKWTNSAYHSSPESSKKFRVADYWGMYYDQGGGTVLHNHFPYSISFGYYLQAPEGSSPLIVEDHSIQVTEGRLIIFGGHQSHEVPDSEVSGRCMIAGNVVYLGVDSYDDMETE